MKILVTAEAFGYGPIATCLNVVKELKKIPDVSMTFLGTGISLEQAKMTNYFDTILECETFKYEELEKAKDVFFNHDVVLSSENIPGAIFALKNGLKNVYYMDNLMWMWDEIHDGLEDLKGYIISETIPCDKNFKRIGGNIKNPVFVGPIRDMDIRNNGNQENKLIINVGGAEAFIIDPNIVKSFYNKLINNILASSELINRFDKIIVCGGSGVIDNLTLNTHEPKIIVKTLANEEYLKELDTCSHCIMASGLGNFFETLWRNKEIMYLPPVNYSQLLQLDYYKDMDLGFKMVNWDKFDFFESIPSLLNEEAGVNLVLENVKKYIEESDENTILENVKDFLNSNQRQYYQIRTDYANSLKKDAAKEIAEMIYRDNKGV